MLRLSFSPSRRLALLLTLAHGMGGAAVWIVDWTLWLKILVYLMVFASWVFHLQRDALLRLPYSVVAALLKDDGSMEVTRRDGAAITAQRLPGSFVHPWFTTIRWRGDGERFSRSVAIFPDSLPADKFRELRVWLKWRR